MTEAFHCRAEFYHFQTKVIHKPGTPVFLLTDKLSAQVQLHKNWSPNPVYKLQFSH